MENTRNQSSLQWHLTRLPTELRLLILEYVVIGSHKSLAKRQMQKGVSYKKRLFMLLENTTPFAEVSGIVKKRYGSLRQFHRIFLSLHNSFGCHITNDFFCEAEKFDEMSAMREAVMYHEETIRNMLSPYPLKDNLDVMLINVQMEIAELSLNLFVTSKVKEKKYLSVKIEKKDKKWQATFLPRCCVNRMEVWSSRCCKKECSLFKPFSITIADI